MVKSCEQLVVEKIANGTVIDHIPAKMGLAVMKMLDLSEHDGRLALLINVPSKKLGKKDIIKIENLLVNEKEINKIALIAPDATINLVENETVKSKAAVKLPEIVEGIVKCPNPACVTNHEPIETRFRTNGGVRCTYCERTYKADELLK
ncbi:aspartate carbamoyltransferase regulatory subunit [Candidatus Micrarchaeota archaeon CG08_land_8_20_14_0_20_49_17]|nr:MAG: aspartate carbamoyltransferase regulatory subunit [Candidatus Micrarchaeota archaeon CG1_02_49_24]PIU10143.1 MAG: aspartate carbamoyltransferase regulatory subunit [Candidatus Micrarchaeota archaeon CG08_land_8_20_14_0_20_49_17]PIZ98304.1 MAG: aspartate carbamoyltransferase regulatory subunit [Candidatus Micrarchaeota archaeon CG_4_10_14_0_2_um_filter_49_7]HII53946.1 aspartate carbamoyltransferase regulatory subunit [Candidatus Micrarchaeota archaeon]